MEDFSCQDLNNHESIFSWEDKMQASATDLKQPDSPEQLGTHLEQHQIGEPKDRDKDATTDIFCTPENAEYYSKVEYHDLDQQKEEIRLLRVLPRKDDAPEDVVECELLQNIALEEIRNGFTALSYCAGSPHKTRPILVDGVTCNVFAHLHVALIECRHFWNQTSPGSEFLLWTDQICIHQPSIRERSHQVGLMGSIYRSATQTLICLSTNMETDGSLLGWRKRLSIDDRLHIPSHPIIRELSKPDSSSTRPSSSRPEALRLLRRDLSNQQFRTMCGVVNAPWWTRAWVIQEFLLSTKVHFLYGKCSIEYGDFSHWLVINAARISDARGPTLRPFLPPGKGQYGGEQWNLGWLMTKKRQYHQFSMSREHPTGVEGLGTLLDGGHIFEATDNRDKIFAIQGLLDPKHRITPDYSKDLNSILVEVTKRVIEATDSLNILFYLRCRPNKSSKLPTWVVDWGAMKTGDLESWSSFETNLQSRAAFCKVTVDRQPKPMEALVVDGVCLDIVRGVNKTRGSVETTKGHEIMDPGFLEEKDELWALGDSNTPYFLRRTSEGYCYVLSPVIYGRPKDNRMALEDVPLAYSHHEPVFKALKKDMEKLQVQRVTII
jgi:heterokaryon incompatibility protein (HET)